MQFAAAFIEYLVTGCCAFLWLAPLCGYSIFGDSGLSKTDVAMLLPLAYVLGMIVDFLSEKLVSPAKKRIKDRFKIQLPPNAESSGAFIAWHSAELAKESQARSSRDRIARGATLNLLILTFVMYFKPSASQLLSSGLDRSPAAATAAAVTLICFLMWIRCEVLSSSFKRDAIKTIVNFPKAKH
jgi:hypothetical protein